MASGDSLVIFTPKDYEPPAATFATLDLRNQIPVLDYDAATDESAVFGGFLPRHYAGGGITVTLVWMASTATSAVTRWAAAFERHDAGGTDLDADSFAAVQTVSGTAVTPTGATIYTSVAFTSGAQMDSLAAGESFRLKVTREASNAGDTMAGDAELLRVELKET